MATGKKNEKMRFLRFLTIFGTCKIGGLVNKKLAFLKNFNLLCNERLNYMRFLLWMKFLRFLHRPLNILERDRLRFFLNFLFFIFSHFWRFGV